jgi:hypothetical protein
MLISLWGNSLLAQRIPMEATAEDSARWQELNQQKMQRWAQSVLPQGPRPRSGGWGSSGGNGIWVNRDAAKRSLTPTELVEQVLLKQSDNQCSTIGVISNVKFSGLVCANPSYYVQWDPNTGFYEPIWSANLAGRTLTGYGWNGTAWEAEPDLSPNGGMGGDYNRGLSYFDCHGENYLDGMEEGLLLTTAGGLLAEGPNVFPGTRGGLLGAGNFSNNTSPLSGVKAPINGVCPSCDADFIATGMHTELNTLKESASVIYGSSILEFDFVALSSEISFDYIFASDEYPEYANCQFNDVFGFFLSGPGYPKTNLAVLPTTNTGTDIVSINNINTGKGCHPPGVPGSPKNPEYYVDNNEAVGNPDTYMEYDGRTKILTAHSYVNPGITYHLKFVIGNVGDDDVGSGVFLRAGSLNLGLGLKNYGNAIAGMNNIFEGCTNNKFTAGFLPSSTARTVTLTYSGGGANYIKTPDIVGQPLPTSVTLSANTTQIEIPYKVIEPLPVNGAEIIVTATVAGCPDTYSMTLKVYQKYTNPGVTVVSGCGTDGSIEGFFGGIQGSGHPQIQLNNTGEWKRKHTGLGQGTYTVKIRDSISCQVETLSSVTITAGPVITSETPPFTFCGGSGSQTLPAFSASESTGVRYYYEADNYAALGWLMPGNGTVATTLPAIIPTNSTGIPITVTMTVYAYKGGWQEVGWCQGPSKTFTITILPKINSPGTIQYTPPDNPQIICYEGTPNVINSTSGASGSANFYYQWQQRTFTGSEDDWVDIPAATAATYTPPAGLLTETMLYRRKAVSNDGCGEMITHPSQVTVRSKLFGGIINHSNNSKTICSGTDPAAFTITNNGGGSIEPWVRLWEKNIDGGSWVTADGVATGTGYDPPALINNGTTPIQILYRRKISSAACGETAYSDTITITVTPTLNAGTPSTSQSLLCAGDPPPTLTGGTATGGGGEGTYSYLWQYSDNGTTWNNAGATGANYTLPSTPSATRYYRRMVSSNVCASVIGATLTIIVKPRAIFSDLTAPAPAAICPGETATLTASSGIAGANFKWYDSQNSTTPLHYGANFTTPALSASTSYFVSVEGTNHCENAPGSRRQVLVTVKQRAIADNITVSGTTSICAGTTTTLTANAGGYGSDFKWYDSQTSDIVLGSDASYTTPALSANKSYFVSVSGTSRCENAKGERKEVVITVTQRATAANITASSPVTICSGDKATLTASSNGITGATLRWYDSQTSPSQLGSGTTFTTPALSAGRSYFVSISGNGYCENAQGNRKEVVVTVSPRAAASNITLYGPGTSCAGDPAYLTAIGSSAGSNTVFRWYSSQTSTDVLHTGGSYTTYPTVTTTYYVSVSSSTYCENAPDTRKTVTVTVQPRATANDITAVGTTICLGETANLTASSGIAGAIFKWYDAGGNLLSSEASYSPSPTATTIYYVGVSGTNHCENQASERKPVTVIVNQYATAADITASGETICSGETATLTASSSSIDGATFKWYDAGGNSLGNGASYPTGNLTATTIYYVSVSGTNHCENKATDRKAVTVKVNQYATAANIMAADQIICVGEAAYLSASSSIGTSFKWYDTQHSDDVLSSNAYFTTPTLSAGRSYFVSISGTDHCENAKGSRKEVMVIVKPRATAANITANDQIICAGESVTLTASAVGVTNPIITWSNAVGNQIYQTGESYTMTPGSTMTFYVSVSGDNFCQNAPSDFKPVTVTVKQYATAADITASDQTICFGTSATLTASSSIDGATFKWYDAGGNYLSDGASYPTGNLTANATYYVSVSGTNHCENEASERKPVTVKVNQYATAADIIASGETICFGTSATLTASSSIDGATFKWYDAGGNYLSDGASYPTGNLTADATYYVSVSGTNHCENKASERKPVTVKVNQYAAATDVQASDQTICFGTSATLTASSSIDGATFKWYDAGGNYLSDGASYPTGNLTADATYYVSVSGTNHCENEASERKPVTVKVNQFATAADITASGTTICFGTSATLTASSSIDGATFKWYDAGGNYLSDGASYPTGNLTANATYYVSVSGTNHCENEASDRKAVTVKVNQYAAATDVQASGETICFGTSATLTASSSIDGATFKWYDSDGNYLSDGASYPTGNLTADATYYVSVSGTNHCENKSTERKAVTVKVNQYAAATDITASDETICFGTSATLTASSSINGATFKWYDSDGNYLSDGASYPTGNLTADATYYVSVSGTNHCENEASERKEVQVRVVSQIVVGETQTATVCSGSEFTVSPVDGGVNIIPAGTKYTWTVEDNTEVDGETDQSLPQTNISQTLTNNSANPQTVKYTVTPQLAVNGVECQGAATFEVEVTVLPGTNMALDSELVTGVCSGNAVNYKATSQTANVIFSWTRAAVAGIIAEGSGTGNTITDVLTNLSTETKEVVYVFTLTTAEGGCSNSGEQTTVRVKVYGLSVSGEIVYNGAPVICGGSTPVKLENVADPTGGDGNYAYQWQSSIDNGGSWQDIDAAVNKEYAPPALTETTWYRRQETGSCETNYSNIVEIGVSDQLMQAGAVQTNGGDWQQICHSAIPVYALENLTLPSGGDGVYTYQWQSSNTNNGIDWMDIAGATAADYTPILPLTETTWYRRKEIGSCGTGYSNTLTIIVYGKMEGGTFDPHGGDADTAICYNSSILLAPTAASGGVNRSYQWEQSLDGTDWQLADGEADSEFYTTPALSATTLFRRKVMSESNCGFAYSDTLTVTVYDLLTGGVIAGGEDVENVCHNTAPAQLTASAPTGGSGVYLYQWQQSADGLLWTDIADATEPAYSPPELTSEVWYRRRVASENCEAVSDNIKISVYSPLTSGKMEVFDRIICYNTSPGILTLSSPTGGSGNYRFQWQQSADNGNTWENAPSGTVEHYTPPALTSDTWYRRTVSGGCLAISDTVRIDILRESIVSYPDIRAFTCAHNSEIDLSKYLNIMDNDPRIASVRWDKLGAAPPVSSDGIIAANAFTGVGSTCTYTYTLTTTGGCVSDIPQKLYMRIIKGNFNMKMDTLVACYATANALHLNQIFGLEMGGTFNYTPAIAQYMLPNSTNSLVFDGKSAYEHDGLLPTIEYNGATAKYVEFEYIAGNDSCMKGKAYKITVILTPVISD